jgi:hypothetical protein
MNYPEELRAVAKRVEWFKPPEEALADRKHFLAHVMTYGTWDDWVVTAQYYQEAEFDAVLKDPPAGIFDERSWVYWNLRYHPDDPVPPLPRRKIPEAGSNPE